MHKPMAENTVFVHVNEGLRNWTYICATALLPSFRDIKLHPAAN